jgi:CelD/BcsL family acetyltransferase involved in cellulose biosynthesis
MSDLRVRVLDSTGALRSAAGPWDDLWQRSDAASPAGRAGLVALWIEHYMPRTTVQALVVEQDGQFLAALPLVGRRLKGILQVGSLPVNAWTGCGDLLLDPAVDSGRVLDCLVRGVAELPWGLLWLPRVAFDSPRWGALRGAAERAGMSVASREHHRVGVVRIGRDWPAYFGGLKGDFRRGQKRYSKKIEEAGGAELKVHRNLEPHEVDAAVERGFDIEHRSWKGSGGTSAFKNPVHWEYYRREARWLAAHGHLELVFLEVGGQPAAFDYGWRSKGVHFTTKIGYAETFGRLAPGQQMLLRLLEQLHADNRCHALDFAGPYVDFHRAWTAESYPVGPVLVAARGILSRSVFHAYAHLRPRVRQMRDRLAASLQSLRTKASTSPNRGAADRMHSD